jgi:transcriptional regulator with XRE-family HTH domain
MCSEQEFYRQVRRQVRDVRQHLGNALHRRRQEQGITLSRLARLTRLSPEQIDRLELGKNTLDLTILARVAIGLEVELGCLLAGELVPRRVASTQTATHGAPALLRADGLSPAGTN